jgi:hypothetical protein
MQQWSSGGQINRLKKVYAFADTARFPSVECWPPRRGGAHGRFLCGLTFYMSFSWRP